MLDFDRSLQLAFSSPGLQRAMSTSSCCTLAPQSLAPVLQQQQQLEHEARQEPQEQQHTQPRRAYHSHQEQHQRRANAWRERPSSGGHSEGGTNRGADERAQQPVMEQGAASCCVDDCSSTASCGLAPRSSNSQRWSTSAAAAAAHTARRARPRAAQQRLCTSSALLGALLGALVAAAAAADLGSASAGMQTAGGSVQPAQQQQQQSAGMVPRVAIVSEKAFHLEVLAGFISIMQPDFGRHMVVYMHQMNFENRHLDFGFGEFLQGEFDTMRIRALPWLGIPTFDVAVFLSPEYRVDFVKNFLDRCGAKLAIMMVHNGDARDVPLLLPLHANAHLMTLSPHVQKFVQQRLNRTDIDWMLPLKALAPRVNCAPNKLTKCLAGFAIQGAMDSRRRNYTSIFFQLDSLINSSSTLRADQRLRINVVGSGRPEKLGVPPHLEGRVVPHTNLRFQDFYELIHTNLALLPALASDSYYDRKFSSTLITSLVTGVPVVVDRRFLKSYTFLNDSHVVRQWRNDTLTDALKRMLAMSNEELQGVRRSVATLRAELSSRALARIKELLHPLLPAIQQEWERNPW